MGISDSQTPEADSGLDAMQEQNTSDQSVTCRTTDSPPTHRIVSRYFSRLFRIRRGHRSSRDVYSEGEEQSFDPEELRKSQTNETEVFDDEDCEELTKFKSQDSIYLVDEDNEKKLKHDESSRIGTERRERASRRATMPGAIRVSPSGVPSPPSLHRYDSSAMSSCGDDRLGTDEPDDILVQASVVTPRRNPLVVKASPMEEQDDDVIVLNKRKLRIILVIVVVLVLGLTVGLVAALNQGSFSGKRTKSSSSSSSSSSYESNGSRAPSPTPRPPPQDDHSSGAKCHLRGGGCDDKDHGQA